MRNKTEHWIRTSLPAEVPVRALSVPQVINFPNQPHLRPPPEASPSVPMLSRSSSELCCRYSWFIFVSFLAGLPGSMLGLLPGCAGVCLVQSVVSTWLGLPSETLWACCPAWWGCCLHRGHPWLTSLTLHWWVFASSHSGVSDVTVCRIISLFWLEIKSQMAVGVNFHVTVITGLPALSWAGPCLMNAWLCRGEAWRRVAEGQHVVQCCDLGLI